MLVHRRCFLQHPLFSDPDYFGLACFTKSAIYFAEEIIIFSCFALIVLRGLLSVMKVDSPDDIDRISFHLPMVKEMGDQVQLEVTPLRTYEGLATELNKKVTGDDTTFEEVPTVPKAELFYWITSTIEYPGKSLVLLWLCLENKG